MPNHIFQIFDETLSACWRISLLSPHEFAVATTDIAALPHEFAANVIDRNNHIEKEKSARGA
jgi:hypothetical protein